MSSKNINNIRERPYSSENGQEGEQKFENIFLVNWFPAKKNARLAINSKMTNMTVYDCFQVLDEF